MNLHPFPHHLASRFVSTRRGEKRGGNFGTGCIFFHHGPKIFRGILPATVRPGSERGVAHVCPGDEEGLADDLREGLVPPLRVRVFFLLLLLQNFCYGDGGFARFCGRCGFQPLSHLPPAILLIVSLHDFFVLFPYDDVNQTPDHGADFMSHSSRGCGRGLRSIVCSRGDAECVAEQVRRNETRIRPQPRCIFDASLPTIGNHAVLFLTIRC
mmetsp:Transcript_40350/g.94814  ORF Transcript_40350/g.94814 Transcript_40350/m.94814 type:complete len:212 (+) Transcript_40350:928-1563(+)